jgi:hypothetical protein
MMRMLLTFFGMFFGFYFGISAVRHMNGLQKWELVKLVSYSALCAFLSIVVLMVFVLLF